MMTKYDNTKYKELEEKLEKLKYMIRFSRDLEKLVIKYSHENEIVMYHIARKKKASCEACIKKLLDEIDEIEYNIAYCDGSDEEFDDDAFIDEQIRKHCS